MSCLGRPFLLLIPALLIVAPLAPPASAAPASVSAHLRFDPGQVSLQTAGSGATRIQLDAPGGRTADPGEWPEVAAYLAVPAGLAVERISVRGSGARSVPAITGELVRLQSPPPPGLDDPAGEAGPESWMRGVRLVPVRVRPLFWDAAGARALIWTEIEIVATLRPGPAPADVWQPIRRGTRGERNFLGLARSLVANPEVLDAGAGEAPSPRRGEASPESFAAPAFDSRFRPSTDGSPVEMVIITAEALATEFQRLSDWHTACGTPAVIRTVEWIASTYPEGVDLPDRIRRFIKDAAARWGTEWVLLGGDVDVVPARFCHTEYYGGENIPTDLYYQCLDRTWNENGNGVFGEGTAPGAGNLPPDDCDLLPEVWLSRIPCSTPAGVKAVVDKTLQYDRTPPVTPDYIPTFLALGEVLQPFNWNPGDTVVFDGANLCEEALRQLPPSFRVTRMYENWQDPEWHGLAIPEELPAVIDSMNAGFEIVHHVGHGFRNNLSVGLQGMEILRDDADRLSNHKEPFFFFGINCNSASLDYDCIAERFLKNPNGGCFAYIGSTRFDFPGSGDPYPANLYANIFRGQPLAEAHGRAKLLLVPNSFRDTPDRWHLMSVVCLGDPLVTIRSRTPQALAVGHPAAVGLGGPVSVNVSLNGAPLAGARVTLYKAGEFLASDTTVAGAVTLPCSAEKPGPASLVVTAYNAVPYLGTLDVSAPAAAYLSIRSLRIDDSAAGNGNGRLEAGETAALYFAVQNSGGTTASGVTLTYSSGVPELSVDHAVTDLPDLPPGSADSTSVTQVIRVTASAATATALDAAGSLLLRWNGGSRTDPVTLRIGGALLWVKSQAFVDDPGGPGRNGVVEAGERVDLRLVMINRGPGAARDVRARLSSSDSRVSLLTPQVVVGTVAPGDSASLAAPLSFSVTDVQALASIDLTLESGGAQARRAALDLTPPGPVAAPAGVSNPTSITLTWLPVASSDVRGYAVFRAASAAGPFGLLNPIADNPMGYYEDLGLAPLTRYFYRLAAQDQAGNMGPLSPAVGYLTSFASLPNWPLERQGGTPSSPVVHDLNGDGKLEVVIGGDEIYVVHADGSEYVDGDSDSRTLGVFSNTGRAEFWGTPVVADIDGDGILDIVAAGWVSGKLYVFGPDGHLRSGWPRPLGAMKGASGEAVPWASAVAADVDGDGLKEIFIPGARWLYGFHADGTEVRDGDGNPATVGPFYDLGGSYNYGTPAAADLDHDGRADIVVASRSGRLSLLSGNGTVLFSRDMGGQMTSSPALADLDKDGELEMIVPVQDLLELHAVNRFGSEPTGWPVRVNVNQDLDASPTVADLDGDGFLDVVMAGGNGSLRVWHGQNGRMFDAPAPHPGFPVELAGLDPSSSFAVRGTPCLGDVTGDGVPDILVATMTGSIFGISVQGDVLPGFPLRAQEQIEGGPLLWDIDGDGHTNLVFAAIDRPVSALDTPGLWSPASCPWPMFRHDQANTGYVGTALTTPAAADLALFRFESRDGGVRLSWLAAGAPDLVAWHVYRRLDPDGPEERLSSGPLAAHPGVMTYLDVSAQPGRSYRYRLTGIDRKGQEILFPPAVYRVPEAGPIAARLLQNRPNPFASRTVIDFDVPAGAVGSPRRTGPAADEVPAASTAVRLAVFDVGGRLIRVLADGFYPPGRHEIGWDGTDGSGRPVEAGVYFYRLSIGQTRITRKMTVAR